MATHDAYRRIIEATLRAYTAIPYAYGDLQTETIIDREQDRYLLITVGWDNGQRVYSVLAHIDVRDDKIWIQQDNTEVGVATELAQAGIPKQHIVLGFRPPNVRQYTEYAVA
jgi:XisI protein